MSAIKKMNLGTQGLIIPNIGLGCMGMSQIAGNDIYGKADETESIKTIHRSLELGGNFLDTADLYGPLTNERLISKAIKGNRNAYTIATKFGFEINDNEELTWQFNGKKEYVKKAVERSLKNLGTDYIDLYYLHRVDPNTPIEETVQAMSDLVKEGKVGYIGLSEVSSETIRKAHKIHPLTAVQSEYSLFERSIEEDGIIKTLEELQIGVVAYSPLGRGFISGEIQHPQDLPENDFRRSIPRFQGEQFYKNIELLNEIKVIADEREITASQLALAWIASKGFLAIPGTKRVKYVEQNIEAAQLTLTAKELERLESIIPVGTITGNRYDESGMKSVNL
ncbi:aryl-alcohol dehydrogenase-like predicted oxidoreductase [Flavobacterium sp. 90]|uniref:aldo/keto reductase n=1 Tax=unclassified Flavobacterium TaxID=196869 RepID=UPI000EB2BC14|nr:MULTISPECIES: aldo/keto reductase [unclassified Flavobacterium]RKR08602.1 aryl-alcohol dehydrogenase-like predicted oxidoreductase [Flavobacterium sp. 81]TCK52392.1 aryl-alcohol dehydrogenase-like predicted oxidoreductase [Flavobacterium sp. 90]